MATTIDGARLTDAHRIAQVQLSGEAAVAALALWPLLDPRDIARSKAQWLALMLLLIRGYDRRSAQLAATYLVQFRLAELGADTGPVVGIDGFDEPRVRNSLDAQGPGRIAAGVDSGKSPSEAAALAFAGVAGAVRRHVLTGGRRTVADSSQRWRRVSDGAPCVFCALLVARGPVYGWKSTAQGMKRYHDQCGCSVEPVYGRWNPTRTEQRFIDAHAAATASGAQGETEVLKAMRSLTALTDSLAPAGA